MYVHGFLAPVAKKNLKKYKAFATKFGKLWMKHGAVEYYECMGTDVPAGKVTSFPKAVKLKKGEVVFFGWIAFKSRAHGDSVYKKVLKDPMMANASPEDWPMDGMRMVFGGFKPVVRL